MVVEAVDERMAAPTPRPTPPATLSLQGLVYTSVWQKLTMLLHDTNVKSSTVTCMQVPDSIFLSDESTLLSISVV